MTKNKDIFLIVSACLLGLAMLVSTGVVVSKSSNGVVNINIDGTSVETEKSVGAFISAGTGFTDVAITNDLTVGNNFTVTGDTTLTGSITSQIATTAYAPTSTSTTRTLTVAESGTTFLLSASGTVITLPAVTAGVNYKFQINGAAEIDNIVIDSAEGDNIEGTLIVAGAVVDCAAEDQINFVVDGENIGDYFEIMSDGTQWLLGDSGVLTAAKMTCTDPS